MELDLSVDSSSPGVARHDVTSQLSVLLSLPAGTSVIEDVELVLTELTSNVVRARAAGMHIAVDVHREGIRVAVTDDGAGWPQRQTATPDAVAGRGLAIVEALSDGWGVTSAAPAGKTVWATLPVPSESVLELTCDH